MFTERFIPRALPLAAGMCTLTALLACIPLIVMLMGGQVAGWMAAVSLLGALTAVGVSARRLTEPLWMTGYLVAAWCVCHFLIDFSYDSISYHEPTAIAVAQGWNPYHGNIPTELPLWSLHYVKVIEIMEAAVFAVSGHIEDAKVVNFVLLGASLALGAMALRSLHCSRRRSAALLVVALGNPVLLCQLITFYIDYTGYLYAAMTLALAVLIGRSPRSKPLWAMLAVVIVLAAGTKFNIFFYQGIWMGVWLGWELAHRRLRLSIALAAVGLGSAILSFCVIYYHPYMTNWIEYGNPAYPLAGEHTLDIMTVQTDPSYSVRPRLVNFFASMLSFVSEPFYVFPNVDSRRSGFGVMAPVMLLFIVMVWFRKRSVIDAAQWTVIIALGASCFIFEQCWWARYVPQFWLIFPVAALRIGKRGISALTAMSMINICLAGHFVAHTVLWTVEMERFLSDHSGLTITVDKLPLSRRQLLDEHGVRYEVSHLPDSSVIFRESRLISYGSPLPGYAFPRLIPER